jgi:hypothetical protein
VKKDLKENICRNNITYSRDFQSPGLFQILKICNVEF